MVMRNVRMLKKIKKAIYKKAANQHNVNLREKEIQTVNNHPITFLFEGLGEQVLMPNHYSIEK